MPNHMGVADPAQNRAWSELLRLGPAAATASWFDVDWEFGDGRVLLPVLADSGYLDVAYELLLQDTPPSWLYMVERGATTVWELWEGVNGDGVADASLNHYSKGAVISFLPRYVAGIELLEPAYRRFRVRPHLGGALSWAEAVHDSPYGRIESSWRIDGDQVALTVTVPPGTTAEVVLPDGSCQEQAPGTHTYMGVRG